MTKAELLKVQGGVNISGALINSLSRGAQTIFNIGRALGSSARRIRAGRLCPIR